MNRPLINVVSWAAASVLLASASACTSSTRDDVGVVVERTRSVEESAQVRIEFRIINGGRENVKIYRVVTDCGCAVPRLEGDTVKPGRSLVLPVLVSRPPIGTREVTVSIVSNDRVNPVCDVGVTVAASDNSPRIVAVDPGWLRLDSMNRPRALLTIRTLESRQARLISEVTSEQGVLRCVLQDVTDRDVFDSNFVLRSYVFRCEVTEGSNAGTYFGSADVCAKGMTTLRRVPSLVRVVGSARLSPEALFATIDPEERSPHWRVAVGMPEGGLHAVTVETNVEWLKAVVGAGGIDVEVVGAPDLLPARGELLVSIESTQVAIPVTLVAQSDG